MNRINRHEMLMEMAGVVAKRGTCSRAQVGCVIARDGRVIGMGYNGAPAGMPHCDHTAEEEFLKHPLKMVMADIPTSGDEDDWAAFTKKWHPVPGLIIQMPNPSGSEPLIKMPGCEVVEHAERNAIAFAARNGVAFEGATLYCTHAPCLACAKSIINAGITTVYYTIPYRLTDGVELLERAKLTVIALPEPK